MLFAGDQFAMQEFNKRCARSCEGSRSGCKTMRCVLADFKVPVDVAETNHDDCPGLLGRMRLAICLSRLRVNNRAEEL